jgi:hypothetical protein
MAMRQMEADRDITGQRSCSAAWLRPMSLRRTRRSAGPSLEHAHRDASDASRAYAPPTRAPDTQVPAVEKHS